MSTSPHLVVWSLVFLPKRGWSIMISSALQGWEVLHMIDAWACHNPHSEKLKALATHYCLALSLSLVICKTSYQRNTKVLRVPRSLSAIYPRYRCLLGWKFIGYTCTECICLTGNSPACLETHYLEKNRIEDKALLKYLTSNIDWIAFRFTVYRKELWKIIKKSLHINYIKSYNYENIKF